MKPIACVALLAVIATLLATAAQADSHDRGEQLIHSLIVFNGSGYSRTFSAESSDTIYLLADTDNFVTLRKTFVFYRPADDALNTDTTHLDAVVDGSLEIAGRTGHAQSLQMEDYTYYNLRGDGAARWRTATGPDAHRVYADYQEKLRTYREGLDAYRLDRATYEYMVAELERRIEEQKAERRRHRQVAGSAGRSCRSDRSRVPGGVRGRPGARRPRIRGESPGSAPTARGSSGATGRCSKARKRRSWHSDDSASPPSATR